MNKTILLAVDAARHVQAAVEMTRELSRDTGDKVVVVHVHEIAVGRFGRIRVNCAEGEGEKLVASITDDLRAAGIDAESDVRDADFGHLSRKILAIADEYDARIIDMTPLPDLVHDARAGRAGPDPPAGLPGPAAALQRGLPGRREHPGVAGRHPGRAAEQAWRQLVADNPLPAIHGRVCYHPCETVCNRAQLDSSVSIHAVERFLGDLALEQGWALRSPRRAHRPAGAGRRRRARAGCPPPTTWPGWVTRWRSGTPAPSPAG